VLTPSLRGRLAQSRITALDQEEAADVALTLFGKWLHEQANKLTEGAHQPEDCMKIAWQVTAIRNCARDVDLLIIGRRDDANDSAPASVSDTHQ
jgi:hypothetical protein